jgi:penicillin-binding protein 1C
VRASGAWVLQWACRLKISLAGGRAAGPGASALLAITLIVGLTPTPCAALPSFEATRAAHSPSDIPLLDRHGEVIQRVRVDPRVRRGDWLALADISPALREAIVTSEDRRFWRHAGVDWSALAASAWANAWNTRTRGASTVTMQLAGLMAQDLARPAAGGPRDMGQKLGQIVLAQQLEARWSKVQILEAYLNAVPLRGEIVGIGAAAQVLFGKHASGLDAVQAAVLAALVRAPNASAAQVTRRACELLREQTRQPAMGCEAVAITSTQALARRPGPLLGEAIAPHLARLMAQQAVGLTASGLGTPAPAQAAAARGRQAEAGGSEPDQSAVPAATPLQALPSTLDARLQRVALGALKRQLAELQGRGVEDGAVVVLDNASGEVLAWVGSVGAASSASQVDAVLARRQPGSTIKPFVYALALEQKLITAASVLDDSPLQLNAGSALYLPRNYDHAYRGAVSARTALASSLNIPAVRVASMLEPDALFDRLNAAGLRLAHNAGYHGAALALGSADVSLLDLTNAYRMLAQQGRHTAPRWTQPALAPANLAQARAAAKLAVGRAASAKSSASGASAAEALPSQVFTPEVAWLVGHILADPAARASGFGLDSPLVTRGFAAVKTGTSKDMRDNWCVGFTQRYTVGVWVGNASGQAMHNVSGVAGAAPVWRELVAHLHAGSPSQAPAAPASLVLVAGEHYLPGTAPQESGASLARAGRFGIHTPREGTVIVLDPEIPQAAQRLVFQGAPGQWSLNGQAVGQGARVDWLPRPGRYVLERRDSLGQDRVVFEVRAAPAPAPFARKVPNAVGSRPSSAQAKGA